MPFAFIKYWQEIQAWQQMKLAENKQTKKKIITLPLIWTILEKQAPIWGKVSTYPRNKEHSLKKKKKKKDWLTRWRELNATLQSTFIRCQRCAGLNNDTADRGNHKTASMAAIRGKHAGEDWRSTPVALPLRQSVLDKSTISFTDKTLSSSVGRK